MKRYLTIIAILPLLLVSCGNNNGNRERIEASGTIEALQVNVSAKMGGQIKSLWGKEGNTVRLGDTLTIMDHVMLDLQLRQSRPGWSWPGSNTKTTAKTISVPAICFRRAASPRNSAMMSMPGSGPPEPGWSRPGPQPI